ncbi:MAG: hypothetical protein ACRBBM_18230 [Pseudomonadaceae bacterium]
MSIARQALALAEREGRAVLGDAINFRRTHPYFFFLVHEHEYNRRRKEGRRLLALHHRIWRRYYEARWKASAQSKKCETAEVVRRARSA